MLPIAHTFVSDSDDATGIGNLDVGAFFLPFHNSQLMIRTGLALPTGSSEGNELLTNATSAFERITDFMLIAPEYTTLRLSLSTLQEGGAAFFRGDAGLDVAIDKPRGTNAVFMHANLAVGARLPPIDVSAELVNVGNLDGSGDISDRFLHTLAVGLRTLGTNQFYAGMVFPLDREIRGDVWILSLGYQHAMN